MRTDFCNEIMLFITKKYLIIITLSNKIKLVGEHKGKKKTDGKD